MRNLAMVHPPRFWEVPAPQGCCEVLTTLVDAEQVTQGTSNGERYRARTTRRGYGLDRARRPNFPVSAALLRSGGRVGPFVARNDAARNEGRPPSALVCATAAIGVGTLTSPASAQQPPSPEPCQARLNFVRFNERLSGKTTFS